MALQIKPAPSFQRIKDALLLTGNREIPLFDFHIARNLKEGILGRPVQGPKDEVEFWIKAGYDYVQVYPKNYPHELVNHIPEAGNAIIENLAQLQEKTWSWTEVVEGTWNPEEYNFPYLREIARELPEEMKLIFHMADIFTYAWQFSGFTNFCYALYEDLDFVEELFRQFGVYVTRILEEGVNQLGEKIGAVLYSDDIAYATALMLPPDTFRQYLFPWIKKIKGLADQVGAPLIYHTDGYLMEVFPDFKELGVNGIQPLEPKAMDARQVKESWGDTFCLMGNVDLDLLSRGKPEEVEAMVKDRIETLGYNGGYCVGSSNTVPHYVNLENYIMMINATFKYGR